MARVPASTIIVVPYSDARFTHLETWLARVLPMVRDAAPTEDVMVVVARQVGRPQRFNRGLVLTAAIWALGPFPDSQRLIFWDVDLIPASQRLVDAMVGSSPWPSAAVLWSSGWTRYENRRGTFCGGILGVLRSTYLASGGHPITIYGWGSEDDCLGYRLRKCAGVCRIAPATAATGVRPPDDAVCDLEDFETPADKLDHLRRHDAVAPDRRDRATSDRRAADRNLSNLVYLRNMVQTGRASVAVRPCDDYVLVDVAPTPTMSGWSSGIRPRLPHVAQRSAPCRSSCDRSVENGPSMPRPWRL